MLPRSLLLTAALVLSGCAVGQAVAPEVAESGSTTATAHLEFRIATLDGEVLSSPSITTAQGLPATIRDGTRSPDGAEESLLEVSVVPQRLDETSWLLDLGITWTRAGEDDLAWSREISVPDGEWVEIGAGGLADGLPLQVQVIVGG